MKRHLRSIVFCVLFYFANFGLRGAELAFATRVYGVVTHHTEDGGGGMIVFYFTIAMYGIHQILQNVTFGKRTRLFKDERKKRIIAADGNFYFSPHGGNQLYRGLLKRLPPRGATRGGGDYPAPLIAPRQRILQPSGCAG